MYSSPLYLTQHIIVRQSLHSLQQASGAYCVVAAHKDHDARASLRGSLSTSLMSPVFIGSVKMCTLYWVRQRVRVRVQVRVRVNVMVRVRV